MGCEACQLHVKGVFDSSPGVVGSSVNFETGIYNDICNDIPDGVLDGIYTIDRRYVEALLFCNILYAQQCVMPYHLHSTTTNNTNIILPDCCCRRCCALLCVLTIG